MIIVTVTAIAGTMLWSSDPLLSRHAIRVFSYFGKRRVLKKLDHQKVALEVRAFARRSRWDVSAAAFPITYIASDERAFPSDFKNWGASGIRIFDDRAELEFGGTPFHFGIAVFRDGERGFGVHQLGEGVWFYSEDGSL